MIIREARVEDAKELLEIYAPYVIKTAISFEYEVPSLEEFAGRIENIKNKFPYLVAEQDGEIIGYCYASVFHERKAYDHSVETSIYVKENERGKGLGKSLYEELEKELLKRDMHNMYACIAYTENEDEHLTNASTYFHEKIGFKLCGKFNACGIKFDKYYDMVYLEKII